MPMETGTYQTDWEWSTCADYALAIFSVLILPLLPLQEFGADAVRFPKPLGRTLQAINANLISTRFSKHYFAREGIHGCGIGGLDPSVEPSNPDQERT